MKKLFIFLLIFIFASPVMAHACHCCPLDSNPSQKSIQQKDADCCTQMNISAKECKSTNIIERAISLGSTVSFSETSPAAYFFEVAKLPKPLTLLESFGSPPNLSEKPLYLLHNILRI